MATLFGWLLENPWVYRLQTAVLAPGAEAAILRKIEQVLRVLPPAQRLLDVGCGPRSWLFRIGLRPLGADVSLSYLGEYVRAGGSAVAASADVLPIAGGSFDAVWSLGLLHHLPDSVAAAAVREMLRVCRPGGSVVVFDAVLPQSSWRRPLAYAIRRCDRGRFMRPESALRALLPQLVDWHCERFTYARTGLEGLLCWGTTAR
ncbi:MAG: class I SAM-dependent methyltransferase [Candidatus Binatia bacterium]